MTELEQYVPVEGVMTTSMNRADLRNRDTDSWTDVLVEVGDLAARIAETDFVPASFKGSVPAVAATILHGREVGFGPMTALASLHSIKGKVGLYAEAMRALVFRAGHEVVFAESTSATCTMKGRRNGSQEWTSVTWTMADARQAGLLNGNPNWAKYPRVMLQARATTELCRMIFPDVIRGLSSVEELEQMTDVVTTSPTGGAIEGPKSAVQRKPRAPKPKPKPEPAASVPPPLPDEQASQTTAGPGPADAPPAPPLPEDTASGTPREREARGTGGSGTPDAGVAPAPTREDAPEPPPSDDDVPPDADDVEVIEQPAAVPLLSAQQRTKLLMAFNELSVEDRTERLFICATLVGHDLESANHLTRVEASSLIDTLSMCKTREDLENVMRATVEHGQGQ